MFSIDPDCIMHIQIAREKNAIIFALFYINFDANLLFFKF